MFIVWDWEVTLMALGACQRGWKTCLSILSSCVSSVPSPYLVLILAGQIAELIQRGWTRQDIAGLASGNLMRVFRKAEAVADEMRRQNVRPAFDIYDKRPDLPMQL